MGGTSCGPFVVTPKKSKKKKNKKQVLHFSHLFMLCCVQSNHMCFDDTLESPLMVMRRKLFAGQHACARSAHGCRIPTHFPSIMLKQPMTSRADSK